MIRILSGVLLLCAAPIAAQGLLIGPDPASNEPAPPSAHHRPARPGVHIVRTKVQARIVDGVATTTIDQVIANTTPRIQEGTWFLPLPAGAVADAFTMSVDGKEISGEVLDATRASTPVSRTIRGSSFSIGARYASLNCFPPLKQKERVLAGPLLFG